MRPVARNHTRTLARLRATMVRATRHNGRNDRVGVPVLPEEAWAAYDDHRRAIIRELDPGQLYEVRVNGALRYELRPVAAAPFVAGERIDVVITRHPDAPTSVRLFLNGSPIPVSRVHEHHVDPGVRTPDPEEDWLAAMLAAAAGAPDAVLESITEEAAPYR